MARAFDSDVLIDRSGNVIQNALGTLYTDQAASVLVTDAYNASSAGALITTVTTDSSGRWSVWFTTPKSYWVKWTDNSDTAYPAGSPSTPVSFTTFVSSEHQAFEKAGDESGGLEIVNLSTLRVKDKPWVDPTHPSFGVTTAASDNTTAIQAAIDAAFAGGVPVLFPPNANPDAYLVTGSVNVRGYTGLQVGSLVGDHRAWIKNVANNNPIFIADGEAAGSGTNNVGFHDLRLGGLGLRATGASEFRLDNVVFEGGGLGYALSLDNSWGFKYNRCQFTALDTSHPALLLTGRTPNFDVQVCYLHDFTDCKFLNNGVRYYQASVINTTANPIRFTRCLTENFSASLSALLETEGVTGSTLGKYGYQFIGCEAYDAAAHPMWRLKDGAGNIVGLAMIDCTNGGTNLVQVDATVAFPDFRDSLLHGCGAGQIVSSDGVTEYNVQYGTQHMRTGGGHVVSRSEYANFSDMRGDQSPPYGTRKAGDRHLAFGVDYDGTHRWGPTGATGTGVKFDTDLYRSGVAALKTDGSLESAVGIVAPVPANNQTGTTYTLALTDRDEVVECNNAGAITLTVPTNASVAFPVGTVIEVFQQGAGQVTVTAAGGVTLRAPNGAKTAAQYSTVGLRKRATDEWVLSGDSTT